MNLAYEITDDKEDIVIRLPRKLLDQNALNKLLNYLELESMRRRSRLTNEKADHITYEIKQAAWQNVKHLFDK